MAANPHRKISPGQVLTGIPAQAYNGWQDVAAAFREGRLAAGGGLSGDALPFGTVVPIKNASGADRAQFEILRVTDFLIARADNSVHFKQRPALVGALPNTTISQTFAVLQEPIRSGGIGRGMLAGLTPVQIDVVNANHQFCDALNNDASKLQSSHWGCVPILKAESGTGTKWGYVQLGNFKRRAKFIAVPTAITQAGNSVNFSLYAGPSGSQTTTGEQVSVYVRRGLVFTNVGYDIHFIDGGWEVANPSLAFVGKTDAQIAKGGNGTVSLWSGTHGAEADTGVNVTGCVSRFATVAISKWVRVTWTSGTSGSGWDVVAAEC